MSVYRVSCAEHAEEDEIAVPLCLMIIALATQNLNGPRIIRSLDSTKKMYIGFTILYLAKRPLS